MKRVKRKVASKEHAIGGGICEAGIGNRKKVKNC